MQRVWAAVASAQIGAQNFGFQLGPSTDEIC